MPSPSPVSAERREASPKAELRAVPPPAEGAPDWVGEMWRKYSQRVLDYFQQSGALFVSPWRFMSQWVTGERETLNPVRIFFLRRW